MPHIRIFTNVARNQFDRESLEKMIEELSVENGKPDKLFMASVSADELFLMNKSQEPAAHVAFLSIGKIDEESNAKYSQILFKFLNSKDIKNERIQCTFHNVSKQNFAWNNTLVSKLFPDPPKTDASLQTTQETQNKGSSACIIL